MNSFIVHPDEFWAHRVAAFLVDTLQRLLAAQPKREVFAALAGGSTPASVYSYVTLLAPLDFEWQRVHLFVSDERMVPLDHPESNYGMARERLAAARHLHPVATDLPVEQAARQYEQRIRDTVTQVAPSGTPQFDLVLLGLGEDGHTASLFPGSPALAETARLVTPAAHPQSGQARVSFTLPLIAAARQAVFLVSGSTKAMVMRRLWGESSGSTLPAALASDAAQEALWLVSRDAAEHLPAGSSGGGAS